MTEIRFIAATGGLGGSGIHVPSFEAGLKMDPSFIGCDSGTTDAGPYYLGTGNAAYSRAAFRDDLEIMIEAGLRLRIPVIVGSAATAGTNGQVDLLLDIIREIASDRGIAIRVAAIYAEQDKTYLKQMLADGLIRPLDPAPPYDAATIDRSACIVGMMSVEQLQDAVRTGADVILAGRCSDSAVFAAVPMMHDIPPGLAFHAGKIAECGTLACETRGKGILVGRLTDSDLTITPIGPNLRCTPQSVAAHGLYENSDPYLHYEPSGTLDQTQCVFEPLDDGVSVRIIGSRFIPADDYTIKLEGAELVGYQTVIVGGIRDPFLIARLDQWLEEVRDLVLDRAAKLFSAVMTPDQYDIRFHVYGRNAVMGSLEPEGGPVPKEVGIVAQFTAPTQELATSLATLSRQPLLHHSIPEWKGAITGFALLHNPAPIERGAVFQFNVNHVVLPKTTSEMFRIESKHFGNGQ